MDLDVPLPTLDHLLALNSGPRVERAKEIAGDQKPEVGLAIFDYL
jgi:hypothetical protein